MFDELHNVFEATSDFFSPKNNLGKIISIFEFITFSFSLVAEIIITFFVGNIY
jgi:hypothetical protein